MPVSNLIAFIRSDCLKRSMFARRSASVEHYRKLLNEQLPGAFTVLGMIQTDADSLTSELRSLDFFKDSTDKKTVENDIIIQQKINQYSNPANDAIVDQVFQISVVADVAPVVADVAPVVADVAPVVADVSEIIREKIFEKYELGRYGRRPDSYHNHFMKKHLEAFNSVKLSEFRNLLDACPTDKLQPLLDFCYDILNEAIMMDEIVCAEIPGQEPTESKQMLEWLQRYGDIRTNGNHEHTAHRRLEVHWDNFAKTFHGYYDYCNYVEYTPYNKHGECVYSDINKKRPGSFYFRQSPSGIFTILTRLKELTRR